MPNNDSGVVGSGPGRSDWGETLLLGGVGALGVWSASSAFDQTVGTIGMFESLAFSAESLADVEWWGVPWFEIVAVAGFLIAFVVVGVRSTRVGGGRLRRLAMVGARTMCWFGMWVFGMSLVASARSGGGPPALFGWSSGTSLLACVAALVAVDLGFYVEHRTRHAFLHVERHGSSSRAATVTSVALEVAGAAATAVVLSLIGFDLVAIAVARLTIEAYRLAVRAGLVPAFASPVLMTSRNMRRHLDGAATGSTNLGALFSIWDRAGRTRPTRDGGGAEPSEELADAVGVGS